MCKIRFQQIWTYRLANSLYVPNGHSSLTNILMVKFYLEPSLDSWTKNWMRRQTMRTCGQSHSIPFCSELTWKPQFRCLKEGTHVYD